MSKPDDLINAKEAAGKLGVSVQRVHQINEQGKLLTAVKAPGLRGAKFFRAADVDKLAGGKK